jgi:hypothetical protein
VTVVPKRQNADVSMAEQSDERTVSIEVGRIVDDLSDPSDALDPVSWLVRPLRRDDPFPYYPEYLDGEVPRFWFVTIGDRGCVADLTDSAASRIYFMADMAQDHIIEEKRQARPWCPVHRKNMLNPSLRGLSVCWQCPDDEAVRCDVGDYWKWRAEHEG